MKRDSGPVPPAIPRNDMGSPRPAANLLTTQIGQTGKPQLLQQMEMMMKTWDDAAAQSAAAQQSLVVLQQQRPQQLGILPPPPNQGLASAGLDKSSIIPMQDPDDEVQRKLFKLEGCRSILALFTSGSGPYSPILSKLFLYVFDLIESLLQVADEKAAQKAAADSKFAHALSNSMMSDSGLALMDESGIGDESITANQAKRIDYAFGRLRKVQAEMKVLAANSEATEQKLKAEIEALKTENRKLEDRIEYQANRAKRQRLDGATSRMTEAEYRHHVSETINILDLERRIDELKKQLEEMDGEKQELERLLKNAERLNGKYAMQAIQLSARVKVFHEYNERFTTLLSMQYDERAATERENELLRSELMDLNKFHQLRRNLEGESGTIQTTTDRRSIRHALGSNSSVPRHLHFCGLMNRIVLPKEAASTLVADILATRSNQGRRTDFQTFIHNFLSKKHGGDAVAWAYSLDEACQLHDSDPNLNLFSVVSRRVLNEDMYPLIHTDIQIFLEACETLDQMQHGELQLTVPVAHVLGILLELFPNYPDGAFRKAMEQLQKTLTTNAHAHYRLLFPNLEREEVGETSAFAAVDLRVENAFSSTFKELILDDAMVTMQLLEDAILHVTSDRISLTDITSAVLNVFDVPEIGEYVSRVVRKVVKDAMKVSKYELTIPKHVAAAAVRNSIILRRGIFRNPTKAAGGREQMANAVMAEWAAISGDELVKVDYRDIIQRTVARRREYDTEQSDDSEEDEETGLSHLGSSHAGLNGSLRAKGSSSLSPNATLPST
jgi:hypothetical protein